MIKGLAITPPVLGRISIGKVVERNGKRLPEKDDQFSITSQIQNREGWVSHPLDESLRKGSNGKLRSIPIQVLFDDPDLNLRAQYSLFDKTNGRPVCAGDGENCKRHSDAGMQSLPCPSPELCSFGKGLCKPYARLNVQIGEDDELGTFIFRTTGFNSIRTLTARLNYFSAVSGNVLSCLPLELRLRGKSTTQSHRSAIYYADITIRDGMTLDAAIAEAHTKREQRVQSGFDQIALDQAARMGFGNGAFEESEDEVPAVLEEFFPEDGDVTGMVTSTGTNTGISTLQSKLDSKVAVKSTRGAAS